MRTGSVERFSEGKPRDRAGLTRFDAEGGGDGASVLPSCSSKRGENVLAGVVASCFGQSANRSTHRLVGDLGKSFKRSHGQRNGAISTSEARALTPKPLHPS